MFTRFNRQRATRGGNQTPDVGQLALALAVAHETEIADLLETARQDMTPEPIDEFLPW
jgi:hypothetical protein